MLANRLTRWALVLHATLLLSCSNTRDSAPAAPTSPAPPVAKVSAPKVVTPQVAPESDAQKVAAPTDTPPPAAPEPVPKPPEGQDFIDEARLIYQIVACTKSLDALPKHISVNAVKGHCAAMRKRMAQYRERYVTEAAQFLAGLLPENLPKTIVYPFGGGDLISALVAYPFATEITTLSLEHAGDPRGVSSITPAKLRRSLGSIRVEIGGMLSVSNNTSVNLSKSQRNHLPSQLSSFLIALAVHGYEPVSVRYFVLKPDGAIKYLENGDIDDLNSREAKRLKRSWRDPNHSPAFSNVELSFRKIGDAAGPLIVHRHIAANLHNSSLRDDPSILNHLKAKGTMTAMTKAASYLLWQDGFSDVRDYLLANMVFMLSDSTGIPPEYAVAAGFVQETLGRFRGSFLHGAPRHNQAFRKLWKAQPFRKLGFRFGYVDSHSRAHLLFTRKPNLRGLPGLSN